MPEEQPPTPESQDPQEPDELNTDPAGPSIENPSTNSKLDAEAGAEVQNPAAEDWEIVEEALTSPSGSPTSPTPTPPTPPAPIPDSPAQSQTFQTLQQFWRTTQPKLTISTIRVLKTTIQLLEGAVTRLEAGIDGAVAAADTPAAEPLSLPSDLTDVGRTFKQGWQRVWDWWQGVLPTIRGVLPGSINEWLSSDRALTGAIAGILVVVLWTAISLFSSQPPETVAIVPPSTTAPAKPKPTPESPKPQPKKVPEVKVIPPPAAKPAPTPTPKAAPAKPITEFPKPTPAPSASPVPTPVVSPSPAPKPPPAPPPLKLTPEQTLIARIQDQVAEVSDQYVSGLIQSVQANFRASRLTVKVGDGWYTLMAPQQDSLANDVLKRAQQLNFIKLEIVDANGSLLARSPVIGSEMVVLKRSLQPAGAGVTSSPG